MRRISPYILLGVTCLVAGAGAMLWVQPWVAVVPSREYTELHLESSIGSLENNVFNPETWESVSVLRVIDGDTVELSGGERLRLIGIDAPERGNCFANEAAEILEELVLGKTLRLESGVNERDRYGRRLGYLRDSSNFINRLLIRRGAAVAMPYPPDTVYEAEFADYETRAKEGKRGLWGLCGGLHESGEIDPITEVQGPPSPECAIKGNISSEGERIYHVAGCGSYEKTQVDVRAGERWFCSEQDAQNAGWRKAQNCP